MGADELSATLWRERGRLDFLLFLLETQLLHLHAGHWHRLNFTASELEKVLENLRFESLARGVEASALAAEWKAPDQLTLPSLVRIAPPGVWAGLLGEHREAMISLVESIDEAIDANVSALADGPVVDVPGADELALVTREANIQRALAAVHAAALPSLRDFLGLP
ncbi:flagellar protein FlgN [Paenarthrobacter sp. NPDC058040]|uniref:flagellar protein FlgN n=1 Tax=Paenarthrobacter sp. NPDC058040 TaxID=3346309 RepID=UPI0036DD757F